MDDAIHARLVINEQVIDKLNLAEYSAYNGITVYEVLRLAQGQALFLEDHFLRLKNSAEKCNQKLWFSFNGLKRSIQKLVATNNVDFGNVKILLRFDPPFYSCFFINHRYPSAQQYQNGVPCRFCYAERTNPTVKTINTTVRGKANEMIKEYGVHEVLLVNHNKQVTEGSRSNLFLISGNVVITPPQELVLPGITRKYVLDICKKLNIKYEERPIYLDEMKPEMSLFISGTSPKILPVSEIEGMCFATEHPILRKLMQAYDAEIEAYLA